MTSESLGLGESLSMALGGMIGGGIYAVLGVVGGIAGPATWAAFVMAGVVALCAAYSYVRLNAVDDDVRGGSVTFVQAYVGNSTLAGMVGWTLLVGYVGSMAMYAFAFGEFAVGLPALPATIGAIPTRPVVSVLAVAGFVGLNLLGARASGPAENVLVALKVGILALLGLGGIAFAHLYGEGRITLGFAHLTTASPVVAAAISFVAFQGWQLPFYDQESIADPVRTVRRAVYTAIPIAVGIYVVVAITTVTLAPGALEEQPHTALARAAGNVLAPFGYRDLGFLIISLSALFSTGSAINATLFSTGYFAKGMLSDDLLPDRAGDSSASGVPRRTLLLLGVATASLTVAGSLEGITAFASLSFIVVFGGVSYLAFRERNREAISAVPPAIGGVGSAGFLPLMVWHLWRDERGTFFAVLIVAVVVVLLEVLYFERDAFEERVVSIERAVDPRR